MQDRYLVQFWSDQAKRYITDCAYQDSDQQRQTAIAYLGWVMSGQRPPEAGRVYDQQEQKVIHQESNIPF